MLSNNYLKLLFIREIIVGLFAITLYVLNSIFWCVFALPVIVLYFFPGVWWRLRVRLVLEVIPSYWIFINNLIQSLTISKTRWVVKCKESFSFSKLNTNKWYLLISNHQNWVDILVLQRVFNQRTPLLKFFLKNTLFWTLPLLGWCCWVLGFPFINRYSQKQLSQNPFLKIRNLEKIQRACETYKMIPTSITSFVEGRRFTATLHKLQASPYKHLLYPQAGGLAISMSALHQKLDKLLNVTIIYSKPKSSFWDFVCGRISSITIYIEELSITSDLVGDYLKDSVFQLYIQNWLNKLWVEKDLLIENKTSDHEWLSQEI